VNTSAKLVKLRLEAYFTSVLFELCCHGYTIHLVTACFEFSCKMETAYGLMEKVLVASLIRDMRKAIENKKTDAVSGKQKNSAWKRITTNTIAN
jgi:hypothetical protein